MRSLHSQLGKETKDKVFEIDETVKKLFQKFFKKSREDEKWQSHFSDQDAASYLSSQIELALVQRARGVASAEVENVLKISLSVLFSENSRMASLG